MFSAAAAPLPTVSELPLPAAAAVAPDDRGNDAELRKSVREILDLLPKDIVDDLNGGQIDIHDPAFLEGLMDHVSRLALAEPRNGQRILGKIIRLKKRIARDLRESDPDAVVSATVSNSGPRTGRNEPCPCGSGRKYKQCCLRKS